MYFRAPRQVDGPNMFALFVDELGGPKPVAKHLGVTLETVRRWMKTDRVPRAAVLALFWESKYGQGEVFTHQVNEIRLLYRRVCILQDQYRKATHIVAGLRKLQTDTANEAFFDELPDLAPSPEPRVGAEPVELALDAAGRIDLVSRSAA